MMLAQYTGFPDGWWMWVKCGPGGILTRTARPRHQRELREPPAVVKVEAARADPCTHGNAWVVSATVHDDGTILPQALVLSAPSTQDGPGLHLGDTNRLPKDWIKLE